MAERPAAERAAGERGAAVDPSPLPLRLALVALQAGALAVVLAALPYKTFELDRYFVPKELALHLTAAISALFVLARMGQYTLRRIDYALIAFLALSTISVLFADNWWLATRAVAVSLSGAAIFWVARTLGANGLARPLVAGLAVGVTVGAATALAQAYGVDSDLTSLSRAPGGTFGNRNFMAHLAAIGTPVLVLAILQARTTAGAVAGGVGLMIVSAALFLSRTRAAWLALIVGIGLAVVAWLIKRPWRRWPQEGLGRRLTIAAVLAAAGVLAALVIPNRLNWKSDNPYLESVKGVVNYREGSGRGRLIQYQNSARMALANPLLGVGPGNWPVDYPRFAKPDDPSLSQDDGMTSNPWPSSDWVAYLAERGIPATLVLAVVMVLLVLSAAVRMGEASRRDEFLTALTLATTVIVAGVVGAFDAVLLLAVPTLFVWGLVGALSATMATTAAARTVPVTAAGRGRWIFAVALLGLLASLRSTTQSWAMGTFNDAARLRDLERGSALDPGSYRMHMRLAETYARRGNCTRVKAHASQAHDLFPSAAAPKRLLRQCGVRTR
jgi:O-antigen ligase